MIQRFEDFVTGITVCYKSIQRIKNMEMTEFDLRGTHVMCLFFLHHNPDGLTATELCQRCSEDKAAISRTVATLLRKGYVTSQGKRYRARLKLTDAGREIALKMDDMVYQWVGCGGDGLAEEERATFYRCLAAIAGNLSESIDRK